MRKQDSNLAKNTYLENPPRGAPVNPHRLVQCIVDRGVVVSKLLPQCLFDLGFIEVGRWHAGAAWPPLWMRVCDDRGGHDSA
jgi:hypothetical protein